MKNLNGIQKVVLGRFSKMTKESQKSFISELELGFTQLSKDYKNGKVDIKVLQDRNILIGACIDIYNS